MVPSQPSRIGHLPTGPQVLITYPAASVGDWTSHNRHSLENPPGRIAHGVEERQQTWIRPEYTGLEDAWGACVKRET